MQTLDNIKYDVMLLCGSLHRAGHVKECLRRDARRPAICWAHAILVLRRAAAGGLTL